MQISIFTEITSWLRHIFAACNSHEHQLYPKQLPS